MMRPFINEDFLLQSEAARELYHVYAEPEPIFDYHNHLPPADIASNRRFENLTQIWLAGDHYKWRAMRANGMDEQFCTGSATDLEKFRAYAKTVPRMLRNPLYHWTHLELRRFFGIEELLDETTADAIWARANEQLATPHMAVREILQRNKVKVLCTVDDPADTLEFHQEMAADPTMTTRVYPTFRPDNALRIDDAPIFNAWLDRLSTQSGIDCGNFPGFLDALENRHAFFHSLGCRLSDHGLEHCYAEDCSSAEAHRSFDTVRTGDSAGPEDVLRFRSFMMLWFGALDAQKGWTKQLHLGALRNNNSRALRELGPDTGFDAIGDFPQAKALVHYLDHLDRDGHLPKTILYNLNPADNYVFAAMTGSFQEGGTAGKIQLGSAWWFLDQKEGIEGQLNALSHLGLLSRFVGMVTDSRSFLSWPRHEYFRRVLCNLLGQEIERGELPGDISLTGGMVRDICYNNAKQFFGLKDAETANA
jgi:glucuronate isomerase